MAKILSEQKHIEGNQFHQEQRLQSPYNRFNVGNATYVTLYPIDVNNTTADKGWQDTEELLGPNSSLRFNKIENFPLFGLEQIAIQLNDSDQGLDGSYESNCVFLPHTIKPLQNYFFTIKTMSQTSDVYVFRITGIEFDNIHQDNFYRADFRLHSTDYSAVMQLESQVLDKYTCITENIGTDMDCIIRMDKYKHMNAYKETYDKLASTYRKIFYHENYNTILAYLPCGKKLYDPYLVEFINKHGLFRKKDEMDALILSFEINDHMFDLKYEKSIFRFIEKRDISYIGSFQYTTTPGYMIPYSVFYMWTDKSVEVVDIPLFQSNCNGGDFRMDSILSDGVMDMLLNHTQSDSIYFTLLQKFICTTDLSFNDIPLDIDKSLIELQASRDFYYFTPIILYIMKTIYNNELNHSTQIAYNTNSLSML